MDEWIKLLVLLLLTSLRTSSSEREIVSYTHRATMAVAMSVAVVDTTAIATDDDLAATPNPVPTPISEVTATAAVAGNT